MILRAILAAFLLTAMSIIPWAGREAAAAPQDRAPASRKAEEVPQYRQGKTSTIRILSVGFAADGGIIMVSFTCDPKETTRIYQGTVSVVDEGTGATFNEIMVLPKIGPLIGRPKRPGQKGFVMVVNPGRRLKPGDTVTVTIAGVTKKHIKIKDFASKKPASPANVSGKEKGK